MILHIPGSYRIGRPQYYYLYNQIQYMKQWIGIGFSISFWSSFLEQLLVIQKIGQYLIVSLHLDSLMMTLSFPQWHFYHYHLVVSWYYRVKSVYDKSVSVDVVVVSLLNNKNTEKINLSFLPYVLSFAQLCCQSHLSLFLAFPFFLFFLLPLYIYIR
jgi:hypothetical protein